MTGGKAMELGDALAIRNGKTVEVTKDRCRGPAYPRRCPGARAVEHKPERVLDLATLNCACTVALGP